MSENICFIETAENIFEETIEYREKINLEIKCVVKYFGLQIFLIAAFMYKRVEEWLQRMA